MNLREEGCWDTYYETELNNYKEHKDEGDLWFGKPLNKRITRWTVNFSQGKVHDKFSIIDIGCGNASLLIDLSKAFESLVSQFEVTLSGLDYSTPAIQFSRKKVDDSKLPIAINLNQCDLLNHEQVKSITDIDHDLIIDIGTLDAICLLAKKDSSEETAISKYLKSLSILFCQETTYIIATCNMTEDEVLESILSRAGRFFKYSIIDRIESPTMSFGGKTGSQVTCLILNLKKIKV